MDGGLGQQLVSTLQVCLGLVFSLAVLPKIRDPRAFAANVVRYDILPPSLAKVIGLVVIPTEAFLAFALLTGWGVQVASVLAAVVVTLFLVVTALTLRRGLRVPCGCFSNLGEDISRRTLVRLVVLLIGVALLLLATAGTERSFFTVESIGTGDSSSGDMLYLLTFAISWILGFLWIFNAPELAAIVRTSLSLRRSGAGPTEEAAK